MARARRTFRRRATRRKRRADVVPLSICRSGLIFGPEPPLNCVDAKIWATPLADGGAMQNVLRQAAEAAVIPSDYFDAQGTTRGLSWLGADFDMVLAFNDAPTSLWSTDFPNGGFFEMTFACGVVRIETTPDPVTAVRGPTRLPNLFTRDEQLDGDVLKRWHMRLPIWVPPLPQNGGPNEFVYATDSTGMVGQLECIAPEGQTCFVNSGAGSSNMTHHRIKSRRFLDEDHAIYLVVCLATPLSTDDTTSIALDVLGAQFIRGR